MPLLRRVGGNVVGWRFDAQGEPRLAEPLKRGGSVRLKPGDGTGWHSTSANVLNGAGTQTALATAADSSYQSFQSFTAALMKFFPSAVGQEVWLLSHSR